MLVVDCAADMPVEDTLVDSTYTRPATQETRPDTHPPATGPESAPTPYGMVIEPTGGSGAKGVADPSNSTVPALAAQRLLTGRWTNLADEQETVQFTPTHYKTYYQNELLVEEDMTFHGKCPAACSGGTPTGKPCFTISGPAQTDCYGIVRLTEDLLELQLLGISTETVVYRRAE
ncbi:hypothetical protein CGL56_00670 [Neolewinella marina]|uniref:Uncharacterized protein n=1 Tax=Neolewinella marina TaxID=438751 RepID=A0A2G0CI42_9BACT|nr:hypothetical protein CGL56_00670 [Neolewinella marina]